MLQLTVKLKQTVSIMAGVLGDVELGKTGSTGDPDINDDSPNSRQDLYVFSLRPDSF